MRTSAWAPLRGHNWSAAAARAVSMAHVGPMMAPLARSYGKHDEDHGKDHDGQTASMQSSTELTTSVSLQTMSLLDSLDEALADLESEEVHDRALAARQLTTLVEGVYGEDAAAVGSYVRESGALEMMLELVRAAALCQRHKRTVQAAHRTAPLHPIGPADATVCSADAVCRLRTPLLMSTKKC